MAVWVWVVGQLECLDIPYTSTKKVHWPLRPQISLYYTSPGGWVAGRLEFDFIDISARLNWDFAIMNHHQ